MKAEQTRRKKITERLDKVQQILESNQHLEGKDRHDEINELLTDLSLWFGAMNEEDREYYQCALYAVNENVEWNV